MKPHNFLKAGLTAAAIAAVLPVGMAGCGGKGGGQAGTFTDARDGQTYRTVVMPDGKTWMKRNLNVETDDSWCYDDKPSNCEKYGRLYNLNAAVKACAGLGDGWRLPSNEEWTALTDAVGGDSTASTKLKSSMGWEPYPGVPAGTDEYGFSALPGGYRSNDGSFGNAGYNGHWWTATENGGSHARYRYIKYYHDGAYWDVIDKSNGLSVRCLR